MRNRQPHTCPTPQSSAESITFDAIYQQYAAQMYHFFYQHVNNRQDAEDLTATTFSKALASLERYEEQGRFTAWLFSIARHTLRDYQRRVRPQIDVEQVASVLIDPQPQPEAHVLQDEQSRTLHKLLAQLPPEQREVLRLRFVDEQSTNEVAARLGRSAGAVKMLVYRAMNALRDAYRRAEQYERFDLETPQTDTALRFSLDVQAWMRSYGQWAQQTLARLKWGTQPTLCPIPVEHTRVMMHRKRR